MKVDKNATAGDKLKRSGPEGPEIKVTVEGGELQGLASQELKTAQVVEVQTDATVAVDER